MFLLTLWFYLNSTWNLVSGLQFLPFSKIFVVHPVGKSLPTDSNSFEDSIASQLMHHQMGFDFTWMKLEKNNKKNLSLIHLKTLRSKCKKKICFEKQKWICFINPRCFQGWNWNWDKNHQRKTIQGDCDNSSGKAHYLQGDHRGAFQQLSWAAIWIQGGPSGDNHAEGAD